MKKSILFAAFFLLALTTTQAQWWGNKKIKGNGDYVTKSRNTNSYNSVKLVGSMDVELIAGVPGKLEVQAESNLQEYIKTEVNGNSLKIYTEDGVNLRPSNNKPIKIIVPFKDLNEVSITGSGDIWNTDLIKANNFKARVTGSGDLVLHLEVRDLKASVTGSGDVDFKGKAKNFSCKVTGSGDFKAFDLKSDHVEAVVSGSGDIRVYVKKYLKATVSGSGDITYKGNPEKQDFKTAGSGDIEAY